MRVLNLVTNHEATFYRNQVATLEALGVESTTLTVPDADAGARSPLSYLHLYPAVLRRSTGDYDLVHANYGLTAPFALAQPFLPVVVSLWGSDLMGKYGPLTERVARRCDAVVVMSDRMADHYGGDCVVIPHGVDLDLFRPGSQSAARATVGWAPDARHVLFPYAPSHAVKDFPRARRVVERARDRLDHRVELHAVTGVDHRRIPTYMNAADALLLTSHREGSPNSVKEAMACNLPVVSTDVGDVGRRLDGVSRSFVRDDDDGLVDALVAVLEDQRPSDGREAVRDLGLERMGERIVAVYESVAGH